MKTKLTLGSLILFVSLFGFTACEKNDYQHPMHRSSGGDKK